ncbi:MAG: hypothetical protein AAF632_12960 [Bacteroidota bacterium]
MKFSFYLFGSLFLMIGLSACFSEPEYGEAPIITAIEDYYFADVPAGQDTLVIKIAFTDGDGDLGLDARDSDKFGPYKLPLDRENGELIKYDPSRTDLPPFSCSKYAFPKGLNPLVIDGETIVDTVRADRNPLFMNFEVLVFKRQPGGEYVEFNFLDSLCVDPLGGRFPFFKEPGDINDGAPRVGSISHFIRSHGLKSLFRNDSLKLGVLIRDRAGNESNIKMTEAFTLNEITRLPE